MLFTFTSHHLEIDIYRVVFALLILSYACYADIGKRSITNIVWLVMASVGIAFTGYYTIVQGVSFLIVLVFSTVITSALSYIFFRSGLFGAADAKALICIAMLFPMQPRFTILFCHFPLFDASMPAVFPFALIVLLNAVVLASAVPVSLFFRNLYNLGLNEFMRNCAICFVAYRVNVDRLRSQRFVKLAHAYEEIDGHIKKRYSLCGTPINIGTVQQLMAYNGEKKVKAEAWVTPELPFIIFITLGLLLGCILGS